MRKRRVTDKQSKNAVKQAFGVMQELIIRFGTYNFKKDFSTPQDFGLGEFLM